MYLVSIVSIWDQNMEPIGPLENPKIGSWRGPRGAKMTKNAEKRENRQFCGIWGPDPKIPEIRVSEGSKTGNLPKIRKKKCKIFPKFAKIRQKKGIFRAFYGAPRPRKWEKCLRTPRSLGGHLYAPAPKQWSIGAPPGFPIISRKIHEFSVKSRKSGKTPIDPFKTSQNRQKRENRRKLGRKCRF